METVVEEHDHMKAQIEELVVEMVMVKKAIALGGGAPRDTHKVCIPEPKGFNGARDAKEIDNFIWGLE